MYEINFFHKENDNFLFIKSIVTAGTVTDSFEIGKEIVKDLGPDVVFEVTEFIG